MPTTLPTAPIGQPLSRVDGRLKVTGKALYAADHPQAGVVHAVLVSSPISRGKIKSVDTAAAEAATGVLKVVTPMNMGKVVQPKPGNPMEGGAFVVEERMPLSDKEINYGGQYIGAVVAETLDQARHAATLLKFEFEAEPPTLTDEDAKKKEKPRQDMGKPLQVSKGDIDAAFKKAKTTGGTVIEATYDTPSETHNPMELHATVAAWDGPNKLTVWDATQYVVGTRTYLSAVFDLKPENVRVIDPFVGGGFGCKGGTWGNTVMAVYLARLVGKPVRLMVTRRQMFTNTGHRPPTSQKMTLAADASGQLTGLGHDTTVIGSLVGDFIEAAGSATSLIMYATPNLDVSHTLDKVNVPPPTFMRAPGEAPGMYALECAMDELAHAMKVDPIHLRLKNYADAAPGTELPFSSKNLKEAYALGAEKFGWSKRNPVPGSMKTSDGRPLGVGVASATYPAYRMPGTARIRLMKADDGGLRAVAAAATHDLGTGAYTAFTQITADLLGLPVDRVKFELGDSSLPFAPVAGGSTSTASVGQALYDAANQLKLNIAKAAKEVGFKAPDARDPTKLRLAGGRLEASVEVASIDDAAAFDSVDVRAVLARMDKAYIEGHAGKPADTGTEHQPNDNNYAKAMTKWSLQSFGVHFVEVEILEPCPMVKVKRVVSVMDCGRIINPKTARSQIIGGVVMGLGMALLEATEYDPRTGRPVNDNLADYPVPVNADVPEVEVHFVGPPDLNFNAIGCRGVGEIGITGLAAAVANAVFHATGKRVRDLPITPDKLL